MGSVTLTDADLSRFARHIVLKEIGGAGQLALRRAHVVAIGAGGIGFQLYNSIQLFQWPQVGTELIVLFALVLIVERISIMARARIVR